MTAEDSFLVQKIATIHTDLPEKFGIPRQSSLVPELTATVTFEKGYDSPQAVRGLEGFDYIWLLWRFENRDETWHPTVRPPRLGGNTHMGVFATRSPFRPNPIGLSSVRLERVEITQDGPVLHISGADLRDGTAILDIKPYLPYTDSHEGARAGFTDSGDIQRRSLKVEMPESVAECLPQDKRDALRALLSLDPRPSYQNDESRIYGISFAGFNIRFRVAEDTLYVMEISSV